MAGAYNTVLRESSANLRVSGSRFIGLAFPAASVGEFDKRLAEVKKEYQDATHHCHAWRIGPFRLTEFSQDDGEPSGTAGLPILNAMRPLNLCNAAIIVIRYFGGSKLGKSGLIQSYGETARLALGQAELARLQTGLAFWLDFGYPEKKTVDRLLETHGAEITEHVFEANVRYRIEVAEPNAEALIVELGKLEWLGVVMSEPEQVIMVG